MSPILRSNASLLCLVLFTACTTRDPEPEGAVQQIKSSEDTPALTTVDGVVVRGGWGSALVFVPGSKGDFYFLTDRGPNVDGPTSLVKVFTDPSYSPRIYRGHIEGLQIRFDREIDLKRADGTPITGVPVPVGQCASSVESAQSLKGEMVPPDDFGIDSEGLAAAADGTFWVSDEYGPFIIHFGADGRELERLSACNKGLPAVYKLRRPNRGMEGLTITPDGQWLVGIMQAPLENPSSAGVRGVSTAARILFRNISTGATREYVYLLEAPTSLNSEILALSESRFLVIERDDFFPGGEPAATLKKIFEVDVSGATDISALGALGNAPIRGSKTLEQASTVELLGVIKPVTKKVAVDLLALGYPHDKPEGIALGPGGFLYVSNDDDFGTDAKEGGGVAAKILPLTSKQDAVELWRIAFPSKR